MAKATANCTCKECGTKFEKYATRNNRTEADSWKEWAESNFTQCPTCWGKEQKQKEVETPLTLNININPYDQTIVLNFSGNTLPFKDQIKALNYHWSESPMSGTLGILDTSRPSFSWNKVIQPEELNAELNKARELNAKIKNNITQADIVMFKEIKTKNDDIAAKKAEALKNIFKPTVPEKLSGKSWNQKIYGKPGNYCFYSENVKINLTDAEAEEIKEYVKLKEEYKKAVEEIEKNL